MTWVGPSYPKVNGRVQVVRDEKVAPGGGSVPVRLADLAVVGDLMVDAELFDVW